MEDVAELAGVSEQSAYNHFRTKQALALAAFAPVVDAAMAAAEPTGDALTALTRFVEELVAVVREHPVLATVLLLPAEDDEPQLFDRLVEALARLIEAGQRDGRFNRQDEATSTSRYHMWGLLFSTAHSREPASSCGQFALRQLLPALTAGDSSPSPAP